MAAGSGSGAAPFAGTDGPGRFCQALPSLEWICFLELGSIWHGSSNTHVCYVSPPRFSATFCQRASYCGNGQLHCSICCSAAELRCLSCCGPAFSVHTGSAGVCLRDGLCTVALPAAPLNPHPITRLSQLQQMLQNFQQQPMKPDCDTQPPSHSVQSHGLNVASSLGFATTQPPIPSETTQQTTAFDKVNSALGVITLGGIS